MKLLVLSCSIDFCSLDMDALLQAECDGQLDHGLVVHVAGQGVEHVGQVGRHRAAPAANGLVLCAARGHDQRVKVSGDAAEGDAAGANVDPAAYMRLPLLQSCWDHRNCDCRS